MSSATIIAPTTTTNCLKRTNRPNQADSRTESTHEKAFGTTLKEMRDAGNGKVAAGAGGKKLPPSGLRNISLSPRVKIITAANPTPDEGSLLAFARSLGISEHLISQPPAPTLATPLVSDPAVSVTQATDELAVLDIAAPGGKAGPNDIAPAEEQSPPPPLIAGAGDPIPPPATSVSPLFDTGANVSVKTPSLSPPGPSGDPNVPLAPEGPPGIKSTTPLTETAPGMFFKTAKSANSMDLTNEAGQPILKPPMYSAGTPPSPTASQKDLTISIVSDSLAQPLPLADLTTADSQSSAIGINPSGKVAPEEATRLEVTALASSSRNDGLITALQMKEALPPNVVNRYTTSAADGIHPIGGPNTMEQTVSGGKANYMPSLFGNVFAEKDPVAAKENDSKGPGPTSLPANQVATSEHAARQAIDLTGTAPSAKASFQESYFARTEQYHALSERLSEMVAQRITAEIAKGSWQIDLRLNPAYLGKIDVRLSRRSNGSIGADFSASETSTHDLLVHGLPKLKELAAASGLDPQMFTVRPETQANNGDAQPQSEKGQASALPSPPKSTSSEAIKQVNSRQSYIAEDGLDVTV